jgi:hypothetical protein
MFPIWCISLFALESLAGALHVLNVPPIAPPSISRRLDPALTSLSVDPAFWVRMNCIISDCRLTYIVSLSFGGTVRIPTISRCNY